MSNEKEVIQTPKYKDDEYFHITDEYEQVRKFIGMYISYRGTKAAIHLFKEIFNNALDECVNKDSPANKINIYYDANTGMVDIIDNGRGIKFEKLKEFCTQKHTTTKLDRKFNVESAGENGVGLKVTAALSTYFKATSYREGKAKYLEVIDGKTINESDIIPMKSHASGFEVKFAPSEEYLGQIKMTCDDICDWMRDMSYICPDGITMNLEYLPKKAKVSEKRKYVRCGLGEDVKFMSNSLEFSPITVEYSQIGDKTPSKAFSLEMSFSYDLTLDGSSIDSFCNYVHTIENGTHVDSCMGALCTYFTKEAAAQDPNSKYPVSFEDCRKGLILAVNCKAEKPDFSGQVKEKVSNESILSDGKKNLVHSLRDYFTKNPVALKKILDYLHKMAQIRLTAHSMKGLDSKKVATWEDERKITGYIGLSDRNSKSYKELIIVEGRSAGGFVASTVDHKYQAVFQLSGVVTNVFDMKLENLVKDDGKALALKNLIIILGCGVGSKFNINNLKWNKVIILTDSDVDGSNITSLLCAFFAKFMPGIIKEGRLYKAIPPLYLLEESNSKYKGIEYFFNKHEYYSLYNQVVANNVSLQLLLPDRTIKVLSKKEIAAWMDMNMKYLLHLTNLSKKAGCIPIVVETVCWELIMSRDNENVFKKLILKDFPECTYDSESKTLTGAYNAQSITLIVDNIFKHAAKALLKVMARNESLSLQYKNKNSNSDFTYATNGQFLAAVEAVDSPDIAKRFKGLGEMTNQILFGSTLNPLVRKLYRFSIHDYKKTMDDLAILHCKDNSDDRKALSSNDAYTIDDIDN